MCSHTHTLAQNKPQEHEDQPLVKRNSSKSKTLQPWSPKNPATLQPSNPETFKTTTLKKSPKKEACLHCIFLSDLVSRALAGQSRCDAPQMFLEENEYRHAKAKHFPHIYPNSKIPSLEKPLHLSCDLTAKWKNRADHLGGA